ncbi:NAD(P)-binding protein [Microthyrium microscopicum]|uniref:NAD(P)-binding protein n=1 Tax=Microthyrium microscopicum TaxID=703497 RepID=A0A6A6TWT3_9PEZI|nr:NAD(P)-binding protein [Microthyrium microscopicum]
MLILIVGITGNIGQHAVHHALQTGHQVRGLGRTPSKLSPSITSRLESFVESANYYDIPSLDLACTNVDAIICAYAGLPELHLDGQLLLLRAAERAGVKRFLAAGWNYDWRKIPFQSEPVYDAAIMFHAQASITSSIKPLHIFSGMLAEVFFGAGGQVGFSPEYNGVWDPTTTPRSMEIWGTGDEVWQFTTERDAGAWGVEVVTADDAEEGGFVNLCSFETSLNGLRATYERVTSREVEVKKLGSVDELYRRAAEGKQKLGRAGFWEWHRCLFHANCVTGVWNMKDLQNGKYLSVKPQDLEAFLREHLDV